MRNAVRQTMRGKMAVIANTLLVPKRSIKDPLKYALAMPPIADEPQHKDWREPAMAYTNILPIRDHGQPVNLSQS